MTLTLPWPPSVNHYWRNVIIGKRPRVLISKEGREYRRAVMVHCFLWHRRDTTPEPPLRMTIQVYPPDKRRRDIDNLCKGLLDALQHAGVLVDDNDVASLHVERCAVERPGKVVITLEHYQP